ncbi:hypothetical protein HWV62_42134 [Athelia sp. TMB]|nr:hypothetical protein HWV62_42134 [Athelia sp. TMB]
MSDDYQLLASERFTGTKIHGYDQITAVSQSAINRQINRTYKSADANSPLRQFTTGTSKDDEYTQIVKAELDPSEIELLLATDEKQTVHFILKLKSGTFNYWGGTRSKPEKKSATIKDWRVVSKVRLNLLELDPAKVPKFVRDSLANPNDYGIRHLLIDFTTANIPTNDPTLGAIDSDDAKEDFHTHVKTYLNKLQTDNNGLYSTIHYLPVLKKSGSQSPTFAPTSLNFQSFPFVTASNKGTKGSENNTLVYLQMTQERQLPADLLPTPNANWIVPATPRYDGTLCLSKATFLDKWLLPQLSSLNSATTWVTVIDHAPGPEPAPYSLSGGHFGYEDASRTAWVFDAKNSDATALKFSYTYSVTKTEGSDIQKFAQQTCNVWNDLEIPVGLNANGESVIKVFNVFKWNAELVLQSGADGKLKIDVKNVKVDVGSQQGLFWVQEKAKQQLQGILDDVQSHIKKKETEISDTTNHLKGEFEKLFGNPWKFVLRADDDFVVNNAAFNSEGDLLAQLNYRLED